MFSITKTGVFLGNADKLVLLMVEGFIGVGGTSVSVILGPKFIEAVRIENVGVRVITGIMKDWEGGCLDKGSRWDMDTVLKCNRFLNVPTE